MSQKFPKNFLFGATTSSYQIEGGNFNCDWAEFEKAHNLEQCGQACNSYNLYEKDFDLAKEMNHNAHRFSIEWSRINPKEGVFDEKEIEHYRKVIRALKTRGIKPFVTLHHFTIPIWFSKKGGWKNKKASQYFAEYAEYVLKELGNEAEFWMTINEPLVQISCGTIAAIWPPGKRNLLSATRMFIQMVKAHKKTFEIAKTINPKLKIGIVKNNFHYDYRTTKNPLKIIGAYFSRLIWNVLFLKFIYKKSDFIGLNHYNYIDLGKKFDKLDELHLTKKSPNKIVSDIGWEVHPPSIYHCLKELKKYNLPIYITENGIADARDKYRKKIIHGYLENVLKAIDEGVNVQGYFYWSLLDNFEWAEGFKMRFGLIEIDYKTQKRTIRESARYYAEVCRTGMLDG